MDQGSSAVHAALDRWVRKGLLSPETEARLRAEVEAEAVEGTRLLSRYVLAGTGAVVLLIAGGLFLDWAWPLMSDGLRSGLVAAAGVGVHLLGARLEWRGRWVPAAWLMQAAGVGLVLFAVAWSERAWPDASPAALTAGAVALVWGLWASARSVVRGAFMPAVHYLALLGFTALFLQRGTGLSPEAVVWILDGILAVSLAFLVTLLRGDPSGEEHPWALATFVAALYAGFVLVLFTGLGPLGLRDAVIFPLDVWLFLVAGLTVWGIRRAPPGLSRGWFGHQLAWVVLLWIPMGFYTALEGVDGPAELALLLVGGGGALAFAWADRAGARSVMGAGAMAFVAAVWYWGAERAGALGAVGALVVTAAVLFWLSTRWGEASGGGGHDPG